MNPPAAPSASDSGWSATAPASYSFTTGGSKTLYAWAKDAVDNVSASLSASVTITLPDTTPPTVTEFTIPSTATTLTVSITSFTATDNIGVTGYLVNESSSPPSASDSGWSATAPTSYTFTTEGSKTLYAWAKDAVDNVSASLSASVTITLPDTTPPTVTAFTIPSTATTLTVAITSFTATDNIGVTGYLVNESSSAPSASDSGWSATAPTSYTFTTEGSKTLYAWAKDAADNVSASLSASVQVSIPPLTITTQSLPSSTLNVSYSTALVASGGTSPYTWSIISGSLPTGLSLDSATGVISGTPTAAGTFSFTVQATDSSNPQQTATEDLDITVVEQATFTIWPDTAVPGTLADSDTVGG